MFNLYSKSYYDMLKEYNHIILYVMIMIVHDVTIDLHCTLYTPFIWGNRRIVQINNFIVHYKIAEALNCNNLSPISYYS